MAVLLFATTVLSFSRTAALRPGGFIGAPIPPERFLIVPVGDLALFVVPTSLGIIARRQPAAHTLVQPDSLRRT